MTPTDIWNAAIDTAVREYKNGVTAIKALKKRPEVTIDGECEEIAYDQGRIQRPYG